MSTPLYITEKHCVVSTEKGILETDGIKAVERMTEMLLSKPSPPEEVKLFEPVDGSNDAILLVGPEGVRGKKLSEIDPKLLDMIASVWKIYPQESELAERAKAIRKEKKK